MAVVKGRHVISEVLGAYSMHFFNSLAHLRRDAPCSQLKVEQAHTNFLSEGKVRESQVSIRKKVWSGPTLPRPLFMRPSSD